MTVTLALPARFAAVRTALPVGGMLLLLAVAGGTLVDAPSANADAPPCNNYSSDVTPPPNIGVGITDPNNRNNGTDAAYVDFKTYVKNVLPNEWLSNWGPASHQAGALAVKNYAWYWVNHWRVRYSQNGKCYHVTDWTSDQVYVAGSSTPATAYAIEQTWNWLLQSGGAVYPTYYKAGCPVDTPGIFTNCQGRTDQCGQWYLGTAPGNDMSQYGSQSCALAGWTWAQIVSAYYFDAGGGHTYGEWHDALGWRYTSGTAFTPVSISGNTWKYRLSNNCGPPAVSYGYGNPGDMKVIGDWNGDGAFTQGVVRMQGGQIWWYLSDVLSSPTANIQITYGQYGDIPVAGDWNNDGRWTVGVFRGNGEWLLSNYNPPLNGVHDMRVLFGAGLDMPTPGKWRSSASQPVVAGVTRFDAGNTLRFIEAYSNTDWRVYRQFTYGLHTDRPLVGDWKTGDDTHYGPGIVRDDTTMDCGSANQGWHLRAQNSAGLPDPPAFRYDITRP